MLLQKYSKVYAYKFYNPKYYKLIENNYDEIVFVFNRILKI